MARAELKVFAEIDGVGLRIDTDGFGSLTDLWKASGAKPTKKPAQWLRWGTTKEFIALLADNHGVSSATLLRSKRGRRHSGTWADWQIVLAYAQWLSPYFHIKVNSAYLEFRRQELGWGQTLDERVAEDFHESVQRDHEPRRAGLRSWVYFVQCRETGRVKIGFTHDLRRRMRALRCGSPTRIVRLLSYLGGREEERRLHQRFADHRLHGEWFEPTDELIEYIDERRAMARPGSRGLAEVFSGRN